MRIEKAIKKALIVGTVMVGIYIVFRLLTQVDKKQKSKNKSLKNILFVGDSQSAIKNYSDNSQITYSYPNFLISPLKEKGISIDVLAKGGETTNWMLKNLPEKLKEKKFDRIYIQGGGNDAINNVPYEKFLGNILKMVEIGKKNGADVFYMVGFDRSKTLDKDNVPTTIYVTSKEEMFKRYQRYFDWQKQAPKDLKNQVSGIVPMFELPKNLVPDGIHPNSKGAKIYAEQILKTI